MKDYRIAVGIIFSGLLGVALSLTDKIGHNIELIHLVLYVISFLILNFLYHELLEISLLSILLFITGIVIGSLYFFAYYNDTVIHIVGVNGQNKHGALILLILNITVAIPLIEEKIIRSLIYKGLSDRSNPVLSAVFVSLVFGLAHGGNEIFASLFSLLLCLLAQKNINVFDRAILHGAYNLAFEGLLIFQGI
jgi:membrane protease YdiL (CAAX protease family)